MEKVLQLELNSKGELGRKLINNIDYTSGIEGALELF